MECDVLCVWCVCVCCRMRERETPGHGGRPQRRGSCVLLMQHWSFSTSTRLLTCQRTSTKRRVWSSSSQSLSSISRITSTPSLTPSTVLVPKVRVHQSLCIYSSKHTTSGVCVCVHRGSQSPETEAASWRGSQCR